MYISAPAETADYLSAAGMRAVSAQTVAELMGVEGRIHVERAHESIGGLVVGELGGPVWELVQLVTKVLNETGEVLGRGGYPDLGAFVLEALREGQKARDPEGACDVVLERVRALMDVAGGTDDLCSSCAGSPHFRTWLSCRDTVRLTVRSYCQS